MKTKLLLLLTLLFFTVEIYSQEVSYQIYLPLRTYHLDRSEKMMKKYLGTEGGNVGFILGRKVQYEKYFLESNAGLILNSFGENSIIVVSGIGTTKFNGFLDISLSIGVASGYDIVYTEKKNRDRVPKLFSEYGITPVALISLSMSRGIDFGKINISPMIIISPTYVNGGLKIKL